MTEAKDNFYKENEDLKPFKAVVAAVFEEVAAKNSGKKIGEIMALTAPEVRTRLKLQAKAVEKKEEKKEDKKEDKPRLHGTKSGNQRGVHEKPETKGLADEIATMNKALGR
jgi:anionic cell wall polymer biosynthesis LytR-Cps2A-Psr (LCP) family protein